MSQRGSSGVSMARLIKFGLSAMPWLIIAGLLWAGIFIKPKAVGSTVEPPVIERSDAFFGFAAPESSQLWAAGNHGKIIHSKDGGTSWKSQGPSTAHHLQDVAAWDTHRLLAVGNGGMVLLTADGGVKWEQKRIDFLPASLDKLLRVKALADGRAWAVGEMGALLYSGDYGKTWERRRPAQDTAFNDIAMMDEKSGWVVGEAGAILRTTDGGIHWDMTPSGVKSSLMALAFRDAQNAVAVGLEGVILVTRDGGKTWRRAVATRKDGAPLKLHFYDVIWDGSRKQWLVVGDQGVYAKADAEAATWTGGGLDATELAWHTRIASSGDRFYLAGATLGEWSGEDGSWRRLGAGK